MKKLLRDCSVLVDKGSHCGDGCCWNSSWESEKFAAGEEFDDDWLSDFSDLEEGVDFVQL